MSGSGGGGGGGSASFNFNINAGGGGGGGSGRGGGLLVGGGKANVPSKMTERKAVIVMSDMPHEMEQDALNCAKQGLEKYEDLQDVARYISGEFEKKYKTYWHCTVGRDYATWVRYKSGFCIKFRLGENIFVLFKSA